MPFLGKLREEPYLSQRLPVVYITSGRAQSPSSSRSGRQRSSSPSAEALSVKRARTRTSMKPRKPLQELSLDQLDQHTRSKIDHHRTSVQESSSDGHDPDFVMQRASKQTGRPKTRKCGLCHGPGHYAKTCSKRRC
ncbi:hypothetical protein BCR37DRAFT_377590 [Protomyces lactucae-debilis]|uniref:Uncharacterized protein n=1 Tax=Protomyces lactucae-debilis TaxID=2754530 RepID=A0A1Y2FLG8_PROLT|nr:uncharacterized protein BCR37DRAFT_377590 [Protomyces lactucae-debilis]ORY84813.1 hypothetical protein BCR37DRAFT_377590 [Protomyces lactucae-debilis]